MAKRVQFLIGLTFIFRVLGNAQQLPFFAQYTEYQGLINPAAIHTHFLTEQGQDFAAGVSVRTQGGYLKDLAPRTQTGRVEGLKKLNKNNNLLLDGYFQNNVTGISHNTDLIGRIAYIRTLGKTLTEGGLSIGFHFGLGRNKLETNDLLLQTPLPIDPNIPVDPSVVRFKSGIGVYGFKQWHKSDYVYGGFSIPQFGDLEGSNYNHYYGLVGFYIVCNHQSHIDISTWLRKVPNVPTYYSFNTRYQPLFWCWIGLGITTDFSPNPTLIPEFGIIRNKENRVFKVAYSYTLLNTLMGRAHEINIAFSRRRMH